MSKVKTPQELARAPLLREQAIKRADLIIKQADSMLIIIENHANNPEILKQQLEQIKIKPDAIELVDTYIKVNNLNLSKEALEVIEDFYLSKTIVPPKSRPVAMAGAKPRGTTPGRLVHKTAKDANDQNLLKQQNTWLEKQSDLGDDTCEYLGTNLINQMMKENSPKFRLYNDAVTGKIKLMSKFIPDFRTIYDIRDHHLPIDVLQAKGFANLFAANALAGDYDMHGGNVGIRTDKDGTTYWARIDSGRALSYNVNANYTYPSSMQYLSAPQTLEGFKQTMLSTGAYPESLFHGMNFALELEAEANKIDINRLRKTTKLSMANLKIAYGDNFLDIEEVNKDFKNRMGFAADVQLTEKLIEDKIIENVTRIQAELKEMARAEFMSSLIKESEKINAVTIENKQYKIDYEKVFTEMDNRNTPRPKDLSLFMESAIETQDLSAIKYLNATSPTTITIGGLSPIAHALKENKNELIVKMLESGFSLDQTNISPEQVSTIIQTYEQLGDPEKIETMMLTFPKNRELAKMAIREFANQSEGEKIDKILESFPKKEHNAILKEVLNERGSYSPTIGNKLPIWDRALEIGKDLHKLMMKAQGIDEEPVKPVINQRIGRDKTTIIRQ